MPQFSDDLFIGNAPAFMGTANGPSKAIITGSITSTTLTVTTMLSGDQLAVGQYLTGTNVTVGSYITAFGTGNGGVGTYTVSASSTATTTTIYATGNALLGDPAPMPLGVGPMGRNYVWDVVPQTLQAANIAASQTPAAAGALTLTAGTSAQRVIRNDGTPVIQLDCPRAVSIFLTTGGTVRAYTVAGFDYYGQPMTETITTVANATTAGNKAFYQILSVTGAVGGSTQPLTVGTTDKIGLPVRVFDVSYIASVKATGALAADAGTFVAAVMTSPATATTGDVRGTYTPAAANNGSKRIVMEILLPAIASGPNATRVGALGVDQA